MTTLTVRNTGDRPRNRLALPLLRKGERPEFDRAAAFSQHLNIPASTALRFEPGDERTVDLVPYRGKRAVYGFNNPGRRRDQRGDGRGA